MTDSTETPDSAEVLPETEQPIEVGDRVRFVEDCASCKDYGICTISALVMLGIAVPTVKFDVRGIADDGTLIDPDGMTMSQVDGNWRYPGTPAPWKIAEIEPGAAKTAWERQKTEDAEIAQIITERFPDHLERAAEFIGNMAADPSIHEQVMVQYSFGAKLYKELCAAALLTDSPADTSGRSLATIGALFERFGINADLTQVLIVATVLARAARK